MFAKAYFIAMRTRYKIVSDNEIYFITSSILEMIPIFTNEKYFNIIIDSLSYCRKEKGLKIYAYVIMDNHLHLIVSGTNLSKTIASFKRHTAKLIIQNLKEDNLNWILNQLSFYKLGHKKRSDYQVWQEGFHPQCISTDEMLNQKINYIHYNPVKRGFVSEMEQWRYSSAQTIINGVKGELELDKLY